MKFRFSLRFKILGLVLTTCCILSAMFITFSLRQNVIVQKERNRALHKADTIALTGSLESHQTILEKAAVNLLNTDELLSYMADPDDENSKMILEGMFLSFQEEGIVRFTLTNAQGNPLLEQATGRPTRAATAPSFLHDIYTQASEDFSFHFYFRGAEKTGASFPVEYCLITVVTDDDDNVLGFAEIALTAKKWMFSISELTGKIISLQEPHSGKLTLTTDTTRENVINEIISNDTVSSSFMLKKIDDTWWLTDIIAILDPGDSVAAYLLVT